MPNSAVETLTGGGTSGERTTRMRLVDFVESVRISVWALAETDR